MCMWFDHAGYGRHEDTHCLLQSKEFEDYSMLDTFRYVVICKTDMFALFCGVAVVLIYVEPIFVLTESPWW